MLLFILSISQICSSQVIYSNWNKVHITPIVTVDLKPITGNSTVKCISTCSVSPSCKGVVREVQIDGENRTCTVIHVTNNGRSASKTDLIFLFLKKKQGENIGILDWFFRKDAQDNTSLFTDIKNKPRFRFNLTENTFVPLTDNHKVIKFHPKREDKILPVTFEDGKCKCDVNKYTGNNKGIYNTFSIVHDSAYKLAVFEASLDRILFPGVVISTTLKAIAFDSENCMAFVLHTDEDNTFDRYDEEADSVLESMCLNGKMRKPFKVNWIIYSMAFNRENKLLFYVYYQSQQRYVAMVNTTTNKQAILFSTKEKTFIPFKLTVSDLCDHLLGVQIDDGNHSNTILKIKLTDTFKTEIILKIQNFILVDYFFADLDKIVVGLIGTVVNVYDTKSKEYEKLFACPIGFFGGVQKWNSTVFLVKCYDNARNETVMHLYRNDFTKIGRVVIQGSHEVYFG